MLPRTRNEAFQDAREVTNDGHVRSGTRAHSVRGRLKSLQIKTWDGFLAELEQIVD